MRWRLAMLVTATTLLCGTHANARDPFGDEARSLPDAPRPDPAPFVVPAGLYYVTDTYVADVVATDGATTTYSTTTVHESTGTYARVIDTVQTGAASAFDGSSFNGRGSLTDGRALAGTYYENFVLTGGGYVPVSIVFFQDDSEMRRAPTAAPSPRSTPAPTSSDAAVGPVGSWTTATPAPSLKPTTSPVPPRTTSPVPSSRPVLRTGVALAPDGPTLPAAEVLRGRLVHFWPRAFANEIAVPIRSWRLISAQPDRISAAAGSSESLMAQWIRMPAPGARWSLRFEIFTELAPTERLEAQISIAVRSPALVD